MWNGHESAFVFISLFPQLFPGIFKPFVVVQMLFYLWSLGLLVRLVCKFTLRSPFVCFQRFSLITQASPSTNYHRELFWLALSRSHSCRDLCTFSFAQRQKKGWKMRKSKRLEVHALQFVLVKSFTWFTFISFTPLPFVRNKREIPDLLNMGCIVQYTKELEWGPFITCTSTVKFVGQAKELQRVLAAHGFPPFETIFRIFLRNTKVS